MQFRIQLLQFHAISYEMVPGISTHTHTHTERKPRKTSAPRSGSDLLLVRTSHVQVPGLEELKLWYGILPRTRIEPFMVVMPPPTFAAVLVVWHSSRSVFESIVVE